MIARLSGNLKAQHSEPMVKITRPGYQYFCSKLISMTTFKSDKSSQSQFNLPKPTDPEIQFVDVPTENLGVTSVDHIRASYTDQNPKGFPVAFTVHGTPGKSCLK